MHVTQRSGLQAFFVAISALLLTACSGSRPEPPAAVELQPASSPREAVMTAYTAISQDNVVGLFAVCRTTPQQRDILAAHCKTMAACNDFRHDFIAAYGAKAWNDLGRRKKAKPDGKAVSSMQMPSLGAEELAILAATPIETRSGEAFCLAPKQDYGDERSQEEINRDSFHDFEKNDKPDKIHMVQDANGWLVDGSSIMPDDRRTAPICDAMTKVMRDAQQMIGKPGVTQDQVTSAITKGMLKAVLINIW